MLLTLFYVTGKPATEYMSDETTMASYANLHLAFEQMRIRARREERRSTEGESGMNEDEEESNPPRVLIIGPENSGKTTACKILLNYAVRGMATCTPMYVNLDPSEVRLHFAPPPVSRTDGRREL